MNRRGLILSVLALGVAGFGGATWYAARPGPAAEAKTVAPELADAMIRSYSPIPRTCRRARHDCRIL